MVSILIVQSKAEFMIAGKSCSPTQAVLSIRTMHAVDESNNRFVRECIFRRRLERGEKWLI